MKPTVYVWSDLVCPYCYVGAKAFRDACEELELDIPLEILSYELHPKLEKTDENYIDYMAQKNEQTVDEVKEGIQEVIDFGKDNGVDFNYDEIKVSNTHDAHRLKEYAKLEDKELAFYDRCQKAYFEEGQDIADPEVLKALAAELDMDKEKVEHVLSSTRYAAAVKDQHAAGVTKGIKEVPHFVFPTGRVVEGVVTKEDLKPVLEKEFTLYSSVKK